MRLELVEQWLNSTKYEELLTTRLIINQEASENILKRYEVIEKCMDGSDGIIYFIENFCWVFEPRFNSKPNLEFFLFDYQKEIIRDMYDAEMYGEDRLYEKSRDMGFSWMTSVYSLHRWLFNKGWIGLYGSRKQEEVDNKTINSFFGKLRYNYYKLPKWLLPPDLS